VGAIALAHGTVSSRGRGRELVRLWVLLKWVTTCEVFITGSALPFGFDQRCQGLQQVSALPVSSQRRIGQCTGRLLRRISGRAHRFCGGWRKKTLQFVAANCRCLLFSPDDTTTHSPHQAMPSPPLATALARDPSRPRPRTSRLQWARFSSSPDVHPERVPQCGTVGGGWRPTLGFGEKQVNCGLTGRSPSCLQALMMFCQFMLVVGSCGDLI
jgi:hypothetical protein